jgi:transposase
MMTSGAVTNFRGRRPADLKALEERRRQSAGLFRRGLSQAEVARRLGVSAQTASRWHARWAAGGMRALHASRRSGRPAQLTARQLQRLRQAVVQPDGARAFGFDTELWTLSRIQLVVEQLFGVRYHRSHVWRLVRALGLTPQRPLRRATERDEERIARWVAEDWPAIRQTPGRAAPGSASRTSPASR